MPKSKPQPSDLKLYENIKTKVKRRVARWPSAYASGMVVREYTRKMKERGLEPYTKVHSTRQHQGLSRWFAEKWVDIASGKKCGNAKKIGYYPVCRPEHIFRQMTIEQKSKAIAIKQRAGPKTASYPSFFRGIKRTSKGLPT